MLLSDLKDLLETERLQIWTNHAVPSNDGGISLGQAALAALSNRSSQSSAAQTESESELDRTITGDVTMFSAVARYRLR